MLKTSRYLSEKLAAAEGGEGVSVVFAHGFPFDRTMWSASAERIAAVARVILPDLRGFGESESAFEGEKIAEMVDYADDIAKLLDEIRVSRAVFCGLSMGGYIAMAFAAKYPEKLAGLILCDTKTSADTPEAAINRKKLAETIHSTGTEPLLAGIANLISPNTLENKPETVAFLREMIRRQPPAGIAQAAQAMANRPDTTDFLGKITVPVLVIVGENDQLSPPESMRRIAENVRDGSFFTIPNAGHLAPLEQPELFAKTVCGWISEKFKKFSATNGLKGKLYG